MADACNSTFSDGIQLHPIKWKGWKVIRAEIVNALQGRVGDTLRRLVETYDEFSKSNKEFSLPSFIADSGILMDIGEIVEEVVSRIDRIEVALVKASCPEGISLDELDFTEAAKLRERLLINADLGAKLEAEKNYLAAIWRQVNRQSPMESTESSEAIPTI